MQIWIVCNKKKEKWLSDFDVHIADIVSVNTAELKVSIPVEWGGIPIRDIKTELDGLI